ncbi:MAG: response regulator [Eubacteriales bacterium]|nr:response regulator [Eubacteriales bacterium]
MYRVLIVDDESYIRNGLKSFVDWAALDCAPIGEAADGKTALRLAEELSPDIVITDIRMPGMDGLALCSALQKRFSHIQLILLTGYPDFEYARRAVSYGVTEFVLKPTTAPQITEAVRKAAQRLDGISSSYRTANALSEQQAQNLLLQQNSFLQRMLNAEHLSNLFVLAQISALGLQIENYLLIEADVQAEDWSLEAVAENLTTIRSTLLSTFSPFSTRLLEISDRKFFLIVHGARQEPPSPAHVLLLCREWLHIIENFSNLQVFAGVSRLHADLLSLTEAKAEAQQATSFASYMPNNTVFAVDALPNISNVQFESCTQQLQKFEHALLSSDFDACKRLAKQLTEFIRSEQLPFLQAQHLVQLFCTSCMQLIWSYQPSLFANPVSPTEHAAYACQTLGELEALLSNMIERAAICLADSGQHSAAAVTTVCGYIQGHLAEELGLESLAALVHFSPSYLSRLFKQQTGKNLTSYIQHKRIERAQELLRKTDLHFYEVAEQVGIKNPIYFSRLFKKVTGLQPKEFKESAAFRDAPS